MFFNTCLLGGNVLFTPDMEKIIFSDIIFKYMSVWPDWGWHLQGLGYPASESNPRV